MMGHTPVLLKEVAKLLDVKPGERFIDSTVGGGGHTEAILKKGGEVLGIDCDPTSLEEARKHLRSCFDSSEARRACPDKYRPVLVPGVFKLRLGNFAQLQEIASEEHFVQIDGVLFDLGFASFQMDDPGRGLAIKDEGPLDMRLDPSLGVTAADLLNVLPEGQLYKLIKEIGEEKRARSITRAIVARRSIEPFLTTGDLKSLVEHLFRKSGKIHPATKVFMALRIAVNSELENLNLALPQALDLVKKGGRMVVISFHSGEDRIVKNKFRDWEEQRKVRVLTPKPVVPGSAEVFKNPRARSAKMRAVQKT